MSTTPGFGQPNHHLLVATTPVEEKTMRGFFTIVIRRPFNVSKKRQAEMILDALVNYGLDVRVLDFADELDGE